MFQTQIQLKFCADLFFNLESYKAIFTLHGIQKLTIDLPVVNVAHIRYCDFICVIRRWRFRSAIIFTAIVVNVAYFNNKTLRGIVLTAGFITVKQL